MAEQNYKELQLRRGTGVENAAFTGKMAEPVYLTDTKEVAVHDGSTPGGTILQNKLTFDSTPTTNSNNPVTSDGVYAALATKQDKLTFDSTPTADSSNPVTSDGIADALATKQNTLTFDSTPTANSSNPVTSGGIKTALDAKQDTLTFDSTPTADSSNPVTSGGVKTALDAKQDTLTFDSTPTANSNNPVTSQGIKAAIDAKDSLPSQTGHAGEYLKTDGETASWSNVESLPSQTGNAGKVLTTDGTTASWQPVQSRNVGEYVWSALPLTDAGLHLLDGSLLPSGGVYAQFVQHINGLQASYPDLFVTQAEFDASVSAYGSCGKFVVTSSGVRLPKVSDILQGTTDVTAVGDLIEAGLPNIKGEARSSRWINDEQIPSAIGAFRWIDGYSNLGGAQGASNNTRAFTFDASRSSPYYKDSVTKPTPQTIKALLYICVATAVKTQIQVDIDNIATDLNGKANKDLSNVTGNAVERVVEQGKNYIRYESGKQIVFDRLYASTSGVKYTFPKAFSYPPAIALSQSAQYVSYVTELNAVRISITNTIQDIFTTFIAIGIWK